MSHVEEFHGREQIDPWLAMQFAVDRNMIDDHYDRLSFLEAVLENDMETIGFEWPDFVEYVRKTQKENSWNVENHIEP